MSMAAKAREYVVLRISELQNDKKQMSIENGTALLIENARIAELKNVLLVLNGGAPVEFGKEVPNEG